MQTQYGINHRIEVAVPPALNTAFSLDDPFPAPRFDITGQIYEKMSGNSERCKASETCYNAIAEMQRRLIHYRLASHLATLNQRQPKSGSDYIELQQLTDLLQLADSRPLLHLVKFDGQLRQMKRDLNRLNVRTQINLDDDEHAIMAVDMVNYQRFRLNYIAIENGASEIERFSETVFNVATRTLLIDLNNCGGHVIDCAAMRFIELFNQGVKETFNYAVARDLPQRKGVRDFSALIDLNNPDYTVPAAFRGHDAQFLAENRRSQVNGQITGSRNTVSHSWVIYFLASMADNGLVEETISKRERSRQSLPESTASPTA